MKYVIAIIQPSRLEAVRDALQQAEITRMTISDVMGYGRQMGHTENFMGKEYEINFTRKVKLEIAVNDEFLETTVDTIMKVARTGKIGDGKIFIFPMDEVIRIRTGETGKEAI
ncbi:MAG: transcriptional regulator [Spirochaetes bacterium GWF1_51_8]|nr:MAG: transcriptional regulator [Spirochaetes bacterium GWF1_51_8]